jgi:hypothetical protein
MPQRKNDYMDVVGNVVDVVSGSFSVALAAYWVRAIDDKDDR